MKHRVLIIPSGSNGGIVDFELYYIEWYNPEQIPRIIGATVEWIKYSPPYPARCTSLYTAKAGQNILPVTTSTHLTSWPRSPSKIRTLKSADKLITTICSADVIMISGHANDRTFLIQLNTTPHHLNFKHFKFSIALGHTVPNPDIAIDRDGGFGVCGCFHNGTMTIRRCERKQRRMNNQHPSYEKTTRIDKYFVLCQGNLPLYIAVRRRSTPITVGQANDWRKQ